MSDNQPILKETYSVFTGEKLSHATTDVYNRFTHEYNSATNQRDKDDILDQRHKFIVMASHLHKENYKKPVASKVKRYYY